MTENHENPADTTTPGADSGAGSAPPPFVMDLLAEHVPLALLADLAAPDGPVSQSILETEGMPDDAWWEDDDRPASPDEPAAPVEDELPVDPDAARG